MKKIGPKIDSLTKKKPVEQQPLNSKLEVQSHNTVLKKNTSFQGVLTNYSTGMRV